MTLNPVVAVEPSGGDGLFELTVVLSDTFDVLNSTNGGPFYVGGIVVDPDTGDQLGLLHCWGFFFDGGLLAVVTQEYDFIGRGKIILTGAENDGPRAITGGTGDFRNVGGEATGFDFTLFESDGVFDVTLSLIGADYQTCWKAITSAPV